MMALMVGLVAGLVAAGFIAVRFENHEPSEETLSPFLFVGPMEPHDYGLLVGFGVFFLLTQALFMGIDGIRLKMLRRRLLNSSTENRRLK